MTSPTAMSVFAQSNHSLEWGVDTGEEFTYVLQREFYADSNSRAFIEAQLPFLAELQAGQKAYLEVNHLETIESIINESSQLPRSYCSLLRINDSAVIMSDLTSLVIPIGDWDFLDEIENITGTQGQTLINNLDEWGFTASGLITNPGASDISVHIEMRYEKENGTLSYLRHRYSSLGNDLIDVIFVHWYPGMPTIVGGGIQTTTLLIIAVSSIMGSIIAFIVYRGIKSKKSIVQRLGE
ncbi:MAG: hypothetical protein ACFFFK_00965 [Candidatus Thorarchaeota archaeon]